MMKVGSFAILSSRLILNNGSLGMDLDFLVQQSWPYSFPQDIL